MSLSVNARSEVDPPSDNDVGIEEPHGDFTNSESEYCSSMKNLCTEGELFSEYEEAETTLVEVSRSLTDADTSDKPAS